MSIAVLVAEIQKGNPLAEQALFRCLVNRMWMLCRRYIPNPQDAEERMLDGFYKCFCSIGDFVYQGDEAFYAWIKKIMVNECLVQLRRKEVLHIVAHTEELEQAADYDILDQLSASEMVAMINKLPQGYRTVFNLYVIEGLDHPSIAQLLGISPGSSKSQLFKARSLLKKMISSNEKNYVEQQS